MGAISYFGAIRPIPKAKSTQDAFKDARNDISGFHFDTDFEQGLYNATGVIEIHRAKNETNAERLAAALSGCAMGPPLIRHELLNVAQEKNGDAGAVRFPIDKDTDGLMVFGFTRY